MTLPVRLLPEAEAELFEALEWYRARGRGLGDEFARAIEACVAAIRRFPESYPIVHADVRRVRCDAFLTT